jgi:hypothetical protein
MNERPRWRRVEQHGVWRVGDRFRTERDGTCTVHALRVIGASQFAQGLVEVHAWPGPRDWVEAHELFCHKLEPGRPDRPPGIPQVRAGQVLRHRESGDGIVLEVLADSHGPPVVRIDFGPGIGAHCLALGAGQLRPVVHVLRCGTSRWAVVADE